VPDRAQLILNHRFAPDRTTDEALAAVREVVGDAVDEARGDTFELHDSSIPAPPALEHPLLRSLVASTEAPPRAKLGWTDVSFFAQHGIPATNFGPGEPNVAHSADERVDRAQIESVYRALEVLLTT
jgi:succinyl-diaminopimelate desuccinylase